MNKEKLLPVSILVAAVLIAGALVYTAGKNVTPSQDQQGNNSPDQKVNPKYLELNSDDVILGDVSAPVTVIEYSDFQCPFCGRFYSQTESQIRDNYIKTGKVKFVYRHFPFLGSESKAAAAAAECAKDGGKFWQYHDALFNAEIKDGEENSGNLNRSLFLSLAKNLGLDENKFAGCLDDNKYNSKVQKDYASAQKVGVRATPTLFINGQKIEGALPYDQFRVLIDQALKNNPLGI